MAFIDTVKQWFQTGDYPTQEQFYQKFAWLRWKDEDINIADIGGLQNELNKIVSMATIKQTYLDAITLNADGLYGMPEGLIITGIIFDSPDDTIINVGTTPGGNDIIEALPVTGGTPKSVALIHYSKVAASLYITGIVAPTNIIILKNSL